MAKKKGKKAQKQADWTSPPQSPKPAVEDPPPPVPEPLPLSPETTATETTQDDFAQALASPTELVGNENPTEGNTNKSSDKERVTEAPLPGENTTEREEPPTKESKSEPTIVDETYDQPVPPKVEEGLLSNSKSEGAVPNSAIPSNLSTSEPIETQSEKLNVESIEGEPDSRATTKEESQSMQENQAQHTEPAVEALPSVVDVPRGPSPATTKEGPEKAEESSVSDPPPASEPLQVDSANSVLEPSAPKPPAVTDAVSASGSPSPSGASLNAESAPGATKLDSGSVQDPAPEPSATEITAEQSAQQDPEIAPELSSEEAQHSFRSPRLPSAERSKQNSPAPLNRTKSPPKPEAIKHIIEESRPPAPSPPVTKSRLRHTSAFDDDDDDDEEESALIRPRLRGQNPSRDSSRGLTYPPPPSQNRGPFASRVPVEQYSNPAPPPPPPGYHQGYYPPSGPSYYHGPPHAHSMSTSGGYHNSPPYGTPTHSSSPYQENWGQYPPTYPPYGSPPQRHDSLGSREYHMGPPAIENGSAIEDDSGDIFSRISQAIPDLHMLLAKYKETHGQLGVREELLRRASTEQQERLRQKDDEIHHLKDRISSTESKHSSEANRLRLEIGNMEEQVKELKDRVLETEKFKKEAEETRIALEAAKASWEAKYKELENSYKSLQKTATEEKDKAQKEFDEWKSTTTTRHDAEKIALAIQFDKQLKEAEVLAETQRQEAAAARVKENDDLRSEHQRQLQERKVSFDRVREELETKLSTAQKDREEALKHERESREVWLAERVTLIKSHQEDRDSLRRGWDEQRELLEGQYKQRKDESDKAWIELHADANRKAEDEKARAEKLTQELEQLQKKFDDLKAENEKEKEIIKSVAGNLETERARLGKLMECYGDVAEIKSKGDTYYLVSFSQLQKQILDLAATHFVHLPVAPPREVLERIPPELPSFLGDTVSSRQLRSAYVAHIVSAMVTFRVFGPFLFSLGRRYDKADSLFASMSSHIRDKSTRKEAVWRQQTLLAAFTSSGAKQRINTAAGTVVDEIVAEIKHFADPKEEEGIRIAVRRIVKLAAETWRFARLEREMIAATMPAVHDDKHEFAGPDYWPPYKADDTPIASLAGTAIVDESPKLLLRLFPVIHREPKHENFRMSDDEQPDEGCIYHNGLALYDDAKPVEVRREELKAAGLPPITNLSPTAADFPPPIIPPPRNPLPPTPEIGAGSSIKSLPPVSPPSSPIAPPERSHRSTAQSVKSSASHSPHASSQKAGSELASSGKDSSEKALSMKGSSENASSEKAPSEKAPFEKAPSEKASSEKAPSEKASSEKAPSEKASSEKAPSEKAPSEKAPSGKAPSEKAAFEKAPFEKAPSEKASQHSRRPSIRSSATPPPIAPSEISHRSVASSNKSSKSPKVHYTRPIPGPVDYSTPMDEPASATSPKESAQSSAAPSVSASNKAPSIPPSSTKSAPEPTTTTSQHESPGEIPSSSSVAKAPTSEPGPAVPMPADVPSSTSPPAPPAAPTESAIIPTSLPSTQQSHISEAESAVSHLPAPTESAVIPPSLLPLARTYSPNYKPKANTTDSAPPTPPRSRAPSPLFAAEDEIEALRAHRSRHPSTSASRRSTPNKTSNEELRKDRPETTRRTSGYSLGSSRPSLDTSVKSEKTDRTERSTNSRYTCESRSAAIKALYPNSPLAGVPPPSAPVRRSSLRREGRRLSGTPTMGTWDTTTGMGPTEMESGLANIEPSTH